MLRFRLMVKRGHRCTGPKHQKEKRSMDYFAGLDVSVKDTSVCIVRAIVLVPYRAVETR